MQAASVLICDGQQDAGTDQLQMQARRGGTAHLGQPGGDHLCSPGQLTGTQGCSLAVQPFGLVGRHLDQAGLDGLRHLRDDHQVAQALQQVFSEPPRILTHLDHLVDGREHALAVAGGERVHDLVEQRVGSVAEQPGGRRVGHPALRGGAQQLVEHRKRITYRAGPGTNHQRQHPTLHLHALLSADLLQVAGQRARRHQPERVVVGARLDRPDHLFGLGGGEDELDVFGGFLDDFQQGVEALLGHHVCLVDDVDLVAAGDRREVDAFAKLAGVVHPAMGRRIDFDHVNAAQTPGRQRHARVADAARGRGRPLGTVQATGQDTGTGRLAAAPRTTEQVGMMDLVVGDRPAERFGHVLLADHFGERVGAVAPVERQRRGWARHGCRVDRPRRSRCCQFGWGHRLVDLAAGGLDVAGWLGIGQWLVEQTRTLLQVTKQQPIGLVIKVRAGVEAKVFVHPVSLCCGADSFTSPHGTKRGPPRTR